MTPSGNWDQILAGFSTLQREIDIHQFSDPDDLNETRSQIVAGLRNLRRAGEGMILEQLRVDWHGRKAATRLAILVDATVGLLFHAAKHAVPPHSDGELPRLTLVAVGGFGRKTLAPHSDIDLLFLREGTTSSTNEDIIEFVLYGLWDLSFKVGHAVRTVEESIRLSELDMTVRTSILEARYLAGDVLLFNQLRHRYDAEVLEGTAGEFVQAKFAEREGRHRRVGESRYRVEPNVKEGKGGLRDIQTIHWLSRYVYRLPGPSALIRLNVFTRQEMNRCHQAEDFLWCVRCLMHFSAERAEEVLSFSMQAEIAEILSYHSDKTLKGVEKFMKNYFLVVRDVGFLTRVFCADLELRRVKRVPVLSRIIGWTQQASRWGRDFIIDQDRIAMLDAETFERNPVNILRVFECAVDTGLQFHPSVLHILSRSGHLIDHDLRSDREAIASFMAVLTHKSDPEPVLRVMNETGVLGRFIPDFGRVVALMQFSRYHHFTIDEHLLRTVGFLHAIESGALKDVHPLATELIHKVRKKSVLYLAALFHDIAKGRPGDHSREGAIIVRDYALRFGMSEADSETASWLVRFHLLMSDTAQRRDISDPGTLDTFASQVPDLEHLQLLLILTVVDIQAVGPGVWNGWKGELLRGLYAGAQLALVAKGKTANLTPTVSEEQMENTQWRSGLPPEDVRRVEECFNRLGDRFWRRADPTDTSNYAALLLELSAPDHEFAWHATTDAFRGILALYIAARSGEPVLPHVAGACIVREANIVDAQIFSSPDGIALCKIMIPRMVAEDRDEMRRAKALSTHIRRTLFNGEPLYSGIGGSQRDASHRLMRPFQVDPEIVIDNDLSDEFTVIEAKGRDCPGLLFDLACLIIAHDLVIESAHVATFGETAFDTFYIRHRDGSKVRSRSLLEPIVAKLRRVLSPAAM